MAEKDRGTASMQIPTLLALLEDASPKAGGLYVVELAEYEIETLEAHVRIKSKLQVNVLDQAGKEIFVPLSINNVALRSYDVDEHGQHTGSTVRAHNGFFCLVVSHPGVFVVSLDLEAKYNTDHNLSLDVSVPEATVNYITLSTKRTGAVEIDALIYPRFSSSVDGVTTLKGYFSPRGVLRIRMAREPKPDWDHSICACLFDLSSCLYAFACPFCASAKAMSDTDGSDFGVNLCLSVCTLNWISCWFRNRIRRRWQINHNWCVDSLLWLCPLTARKKWEPPCYACVDCCVTCYPYTHLCSVAQILHQTTVPIRETGPYAMPKEVPEEGLELYRKYASKRAGLKGPSTHPTHGKHQG